ncbi:hypothetical protein Taro_013677 [Colocasia esculenta]|uniref:Uncharacterized protein n=1 Tax=Colocasia esculenta TaxID=4460 RepID=A0A843U749_COLES|nr:hypothetical protein [Colocasia esculenta]
MPRRRYMYAGSNRARALVSPPGSVRISPDWIGSADLIGLAWDDPCLISDPSLLCYLVSNSSHILVFYITWWFIHFVDGFFSPIYTQLGINIFVSFWFSGLGFMTSITFIFLVGVFMSSWLGTSVLGLGEWFIKRMPFIRHIYNACKQISAAVSPDQDTQAFKEVAIIRHPRIGEHALGFITSTVVLQSISVDTLTYQNKVVVILLLSGVALTCFKLNMTGYSGHEELCCVYVPTNHLYLGDIILINPKDIIRPNLSVREGIGNPAIFMLQCTYPHPHCIQY